MANKNLASKLLQTPTYDLEEFVAEAYSLTSDSRLVSKLPLYERYQIARTALVDIIKSGEKAAEIGKAFLIEKKLPLNKVSENLLEIIQDPESHGINLDEIDKVVDAAYFITGDEKLKSSVGNRVENAKAILQDIKDNKKDVFVAGAFNNLSEKINSLAEAAREEDQIITKARAGQFFNQVNSIHRLRRGRISLPSMPSIPVGSMFSRIGSALANSSGPIGFVARFLSRIFKNLTSKAAVSFKTRSSETTAGISFGMLGLGLLLGGPVGAILTGAGILTGVGSLIGLLGRITLGVFAALFAGIFAIIGALLIPLLVAAGAITLFVIFSIYIINTGAYITPPSAGFSIIGGPSGPLPEGCPSGWPVQSGAISQGPDGGFSHPGYEAVDIAVNLGNPVRATHRGRIVILEGGAYGKHVHLESECNGTVFLSRYAHLSVIPASVAAGSIIEAGTVIGLSGNTGASTAPHLHYEFRIGTSTDSLRAGPPPQNPPYLNIPYIPKSIPRGCGLAPNLCNTLIP